jgi:hypothetical protein
MIEHTNEAGRVYRAARWTRVALIIVLVWFGVWEWACLAGDAPLVWVIVINPVVATFLYVRAARMGVVADDSRLVLRYLLFRRSMP